MPTQPFTGVDNPQRDSTRLPRSLSALETWGFGLTGHLGWVTNAPAIHMALGPAAIFVWLPAVFVGVLLNLQVKRLGEQWPEMSGGTPNYITRLLSNYPAVGRYAAIAYFLAWATFPPASAIILTEIVKANLEPFGIASPELILKIAFTLIVYIVALSGTRTLAILQAFFIFPAIGFLLVFCVQGLGWLAFSPNSPGFFPTSWPHLTWIDWGKWSLFAIMSSCACETASSFVADSRRPGETLRFLSLAAWLIPPVCLGGSWVLARLAASPGVNDNSYSLLVTAATMFWGAWATLPVTLLLASSCLVIAATSVANAPRVLYQLALDGYISPVFSIVSPEGVLQPALVFSLLISLIALGWGDLAQLVVLTCAPAMVTFMALHLGLWLRRVQPEIRWGRLSLGFFAFDTLVLVMVGAGWGWQNLAIGLLLPVAIVAADAVIRRVSLPPFSPQWWVRRTVVPFNSKFKDFLVLQVVTLLVLVCSATVIGWALRAILDRSAESAGNDLLIVLLIIVAFFAIAIACWTSLPQVASIAKAREQAENLFITALDTVPDTILVVGKNGVILQTNPAASALFDIDTVELLGRHLYDFLPAITLEPELGQSRSELILKRSEDNLRTLEATISHRANRKLQEYIVILRDVTDRKQVELELRETLQLKEQLAATATDQAEQLEGALQELRQTQERLLQSVESDRVLTHVTDQIRRTLDLKTILETIVREVLALLHTDRVVIYQFTQDWQGKIVVEAASGEWQLLQGEEYADECFPTDYARLYSYGRVRAVDNIAESDLNPCHKKFLLELNIKANLVVPIRIDYYLWGLLIAHECAAPRVWQPAEIELLQQLANQAAIAIQQAELYQQSCSAVQTATAQAQKLEQALQQLQQAQAQLVQSEKMSSLGQLVAGVAHEINNPVNFIYGNLTYVNDYTQALMTLINLYQEGYSHTDPKIQDIIEEIDLEFLLEDLPKTVSSMKMGANRIREIVLTLRNFSRLDEAEMKPVDIHEGLDSTLLILQNRLKAKPELPGITIIKEYGQLPAVECYAGQLNQVFMNILSNGIDALHKHDEARTPEQIKNNPSTIAISSRVLDSNRVEIRFKDNGPGMTENIQKRVFDPFFTTKPVGEGTGLGLSISYQIIADKHGGQMKCISQPGAGAEFIIEIPIRQSACAKMKID
ncbi:MAG: amino acid permease [Microcoleus vaginatus WJT46-NPBG5]|jgi:PAS domain S-box-containing protein|nr:amino acid permease [Microcoleus vaginatus WJT46-NPBG5]